MLKIFVIIQIYEHLSLDLYQNPEERGFIEEVLKRLVKTGKPYRKKDSTPIWARDCKGV
jgi:hypothetical protein